MHQWYTAWKLRNRGNNGYGRGPNDVSLAERQLFMRLSYMWRQISSAASLIWRPNLDPWYVTGRASIVSAPPVLMDCIGTLSLTVDWDCKSSSLAHVFLTLSFFSRCVFHYVMFQPRYTRQFPSSRTSHIPCIFICVAPIISVVLLCTFYLSRSSNYHPSFPSLLQHGNVAYNKEHFVQDILNSEIDGPFNNTSLTTLCSRQDWIEGLVIECVGFGGGVGNIRNVFLNCFRYAIEAGGLLTSFINTFDNISNSVA